MGRPIPKDSIQNDSNPEGTISQETIRNDLLAKLPQYVPIAHEGYPRWMQEIMAPPKPVPLAADLSSHPLTHGILGGDIFRHRVRIFSTDSLHGEEQAFLADNCFILSREISSTCGTHGSKHTIWADILPWRGRGVLLSLSSRDG
jgi:hypothetical protein